MALVPPVDTDWGGLKFAAGCGANSAEGRTWFTETEGRRMRRCIWARFGLTPEAAERFRAREGDRLRRLSLPADLPEGVSCPVPIGMRRVALLLFAEWQGDWVGLAVVDEGEPFRGGGPAPEDN
jgi:hypothetical protein